ncbi:MAG: hypothetical protein WBC99_02045 [Candidatus Omnitrophota bacterium]
MKFCVSLALILAVFSGNCSYASENIENIGLFISGRVNNVYKDAPIKATKTLYIGKKTSTSKEKRDINDRLDKSLKFLFEDTLREKGYNVKYLNDMDFIKDLRSVKISEFIELCNEHNIAPDAFLFVFYKTSTTKSFVVHVYEGFFIKTKIMLYRNGPAPEMLLNEFIEASYLDKISEPYAQGRQMEISKKFFDYNKHYHLFSVTNSLYKRLMETVEKRFNKRR